MIDRHAGLQLSLDTGDIAQTFVVEAIRFFVIRPSWLDRLNRFIANLLDMTVCTWPFLLPWFLPTILAASASASATEFGMPPQTALSIGMHNTYAWALVGAVLLAVTTGFGRRWESADAPPSHRHAP